MARMFFRSDQRVFAVFAGTNVFFFLVFVLHAATSTAASLPYHLALLALFVVIQGALGAVLYQMIGANLRTANTLGVLFQGAPFGICSVGSDGTVLQCNASMASFLGRERFAHAVGARVTDLFGSAGSDLAALLEKGLAGDPFDREVHIGIGATNAWYRISGVPVKADDGTLQQLVLIAEDITPQRRLAEVMGEQAALLESQVAARTAELASLQELYRTVLDVNLVGIYVLQEGMFRYVNPAFHAMFGYGPDEMIGMPWQRVCTPAGIRTVTDSGIEDRLRGVGGAKKYVFEGKRKNGEAFFAEVFSNPAVYQGKPAIIGSMRDVTEDVRSKERMVELQELRSRFIRIVAHQLRTPLNAMRWNMESMLAGEMGKLTKEQQEFLRTTHDADVEVIRRIHGLLAAMEIEEGTALVHTGAVSLEDVWNALWQETADRCRARGIACVRGGARPLPAIRGDRQKIAEAVGAVLENAVQYTPGGGRIAADWTVADGRVRVTVADTGIGIPAAEQERLFTRFFRATNAVLARPDASGLGLANARYYVEQHGGRIGFSSQENKGSTFWIDLPLSV